MLKLDQNVGLSVIIRKILERAVFTSFQKYRKFSEIGENEIFLKI